MSRKQVNYEMQTLSKILKTGISKDKDILNYIIPNLRFEYEMNNEGIGGYNISTSPIYADTVYSVSLDHVKMPLNLIK